MKKILFTGFMASILTIAGAYAANPTVTYGTELTTKSYVDGAAVWAKEAGEEAADAVQDNLDTHTTNADIHVTAEQKEAWTAKQDAITDLGTIRSGAAAGATAVQPTALATVATTGSYTDLSNVPTDLGEFTNSAGYLKSADISGKADAANVYTKTQVDGFLDNKVDKVTGSSLVADTKVASYDEHIADGDIHVTAAQKEAWTAKQDALDTTQMAAVNSGITAAKVADYDDYATTIDGKADSATTLAGYGITDAYTKDEVDTLIDGLVTVDTWNSDDIYTPSSQSGGQA